MTYSEETLAEMRELMGRYPEARSALLPMLHLLQSVDGRVTTEGIELCADLLGISAAEVSGVATFYTVVFAPGRRQRRDNCGRCRHAGADRVQRGL